MKKLVLAAALGLVSACSSLPDSIKGPFAHSAQGATTADTVDQGTLDSPYPAATDAGKF
jgi:starvation-inducible outer membrane lipoprotein